MNWKDTVFKQSEIKWKNPKFKYVDDNKTDLILTIPITGLLEQQAFRSFTRGVYEGLQFAGNLSTDRPNDIPQSLKDKFIEWGMPQKAIDSIGERK